MSLSLARPQVKLIYKLQTIVGFIDSVASSGGCMLGHVHPGQWPVHPHTDDEDYILYRLAIHSHDQRSHISHAHAVV